MFNTLAGSGRDPIPSLIAGVAPCSVLQHTLRSSLRMTIDPADVIRTDAVSGSAAGVVNGTTIVMPP
jgi:hypothetical protein